MQLVVLSVILASSNHLDKTVLCLGVGSYIKRKNKLPEWLIATVKRYPEVPPGSVAEMILNWDDGNNTIFKFRSDSMSASDFKASKRGKWISQIPKFCNHISVVVDENLSPTLLKYSPLGILLEVLL